jgi:hypothetical protein
MRKFLITEQEKNYIKNLYNLQNLNEQTPVTTTGESSTELTIEKKIDFPAGYYNSSYLETLKPELDRIVNFIKSNPDNSYLVNIEIKAGESRIPNTDNESSSKDELPTGELSNRRKLTISKFIDEYIESSDVDNFELKSLPAETVLGATEWVGQDFCPSSSLRSDDKIGRECLNKNFNPKNNKPNWANGKTTVYKDIKSKYDTEQFVYLKITVDKNDTNDEDCLNNMKIQLNYETGKHYCNSSIYELYLNGRLLLRDSDNRPYASLNNGIKPNEFKGTNFLGKPKTFTPKDIEYYDNSITGPDSEPDYGGKRYNSFTITPEIAKSLLEGGLKSFSIVAICRNPTNQTKWNGGCHKDVSKITIINGLGQTKEIQVVTPNGRDEEKLLVKIDACGNEIVS